MLIKRCEFLSAKRLKHIFLNLFLSCLPKQNKQPKKILGNFGNEKSFQSFQRFFSELNSTANSHFNALGKMLAIATRKNPVTSSSENTNPKFKYFCSQ